MKKLLILIILLMAVPVSAADWYIAEWGSDLNEGTGETNPKKTFGNIANNWSDGDTVFCIYEPRRHVENFVIDGSNAADNITIVNYSDTGKYMWRATSNANNCISISAHNVVDSLTIDGLQFGEDLIDEYQVAVFFSSFSADNLTFRNNSFYGGLSAVLWVNPTVNMRDVYFYNNVFQSPHTAWAFQAQIGANASCSNVLVYNNVFINSPNTKAFTGGGNLPGSSFQGQVYNNIFEGCLNGIEVIENTVTEIHINYNAYYNNTIDVNDVDGQGWTAGADSYSGSAFLSDTLALGDTFYYCYWSGNTPDSIRAGGTVALSRGVNGDTTDGESIAIRRFLQHEQFLTGDSVDIVLGYYGISVVPPVPPFSFNIGRDGLWSKSLQFRKLKENYDIHPDGQSPEEMFRRIAEEEPTLIEFLENPISHTEKIRAIGDQTMNPQPLYGGYGTGGYNTGGYGF